MKKYNSDYYSRMRYKTITIALFVIIPILVFNCSVALYVPTKLEADHAGVSLDTLVKGREMYIRNCNSCHGLYLPEKFSKIQWGENVERMKKKAKINDDQKEIILKYLTSKSL
jgi:hypothetical protein